MSSFNFLEIVNKADKESYIPFECPVCGTVMRDNHDCSFINRYGCCSLCVDEVVWPNKQRWEKNWRPGKRKKARMRKKRLEMPSYYVK